MNCRKARGLIDQLLDGTLDDRTALDEHLAHCDACRSAFARLQRVQDAVSRSVRSSPDEARLDRITAGILEGARHPEPHVAPAPGRPRWASFAAAAVVVAFALGLGMGRVVWPREMVVTKVVPKREVVEKVVEVQVPVIEERVVVREVPVVKTRVVYRDRPAPPQPAPEVSGQPLLPTEVVKADEFVVSLKDTVRLALRTPSPSYTRLPLGQPSLNLRATGKTMRVKMELPEMSCLHRTPRAPSSALGEEGQP